MHVAIQQAKNTSNKSLVYNIWHQKKKRIELKAGLIVRIDLFSNKETGFKKSSQFNS